MVYYLAPYVGDGKTVETAFTPSVLMPGWGAVDLREDPGAGGECLLSLPSASAHPSLTKLADSAEEPLAAASKAHLAKHRPANSAETAFHRAVGEMLLFPAGKRKALQPNLLTRRYEVFLGSPTPFFIQQILSGGALPATDDFNRADADPIGGNWTTAPLSVSAMKILSNVMRPTTSGSAAFWNADTFGNDQYSQAKVTNPNFGGGPAVRMRTSTQFDCYWNWCGDTTNVRIYKVINNGLTLLTSPNYTRADGDLIKLDGVGTTLTSYKNGTAQASPATDMDITSGAAGVYANNTAGSYDDWEGGNVSSQSVVPVLLRQYRARGE